MSKGTVENSAPYSRTLRRLHLAIIGFVILLATTGFMIYFRKSLGLQPFKMRLVWIHAIIAYSFLIVITWRILLGFFGAKIDRLSTTLPNKRSLGRFFGQRGKPRFAGRSPTSRMLAGALYLFIASNAATGLVRAGTDLYLPPFGPIVAHYVAADGADPGTLKPGQKDNTDPYRYGRVSGGKIILGKIHIYGAFIITTLALIHSIGTLSTEWSAPTRPGKDKRRGPARIMLFGPEQKRDD